MVSRSVTTESGYAACCRKASGFPGKIAHSTVFATRDGSAFALGENRLMASLGRAKPFRTVPSPPVGGSIVTRKYLYVLRKISNLRVLSGEQAAEPQVLFTKLKSNLDKGDSSELVCFQTCFSLVAATHVAAASRIY